MISIFVSINRKLGTTFMVANFDKADDDKSLLGY